jgi:mercuric ion binding protein
MKVRFMIAFLLAQLSLPLWAGTQTVSLSVPGMTCPACPLTVKMALNEIEGVLKVDVNYPEREAIVSFDDTLTSTEKLTEATRDAGYPSFPKSSSSDKN